MLRTVLPIAAAALLGIGAFAGVGWSQNDRGVCEGNTAEVTVEQAKKADANLGSVYGHALTVATRFGSKDAVRLKDTERKWIAYRDAACDAEFALYQGGTAGGPARFACILRITDERIRL